MTKYSELKSLLFKATIPPCKECNHPLSIHQFNNGRYWCSYVNCICSDKTRELKK